MSTVDSEISSPSTGWARTSVAYWAVTGAFVLIFLFSAVWSLVDPAGARADTVALGFPAYSVYPLAVAKLAGLAVILSRRSRLLTGLAFAGFFYDLVLALSAHLVQADPVRGSQAAVALVVTVAAYGVDRHRHAARPRPGSRPGSRA